MISNNLPLHSAFLLVLLEVHASRLNMLMIIVTNHFMLAPLPAPHAADTHTLTVLLLKLTVFLQFNYAYIEYTCTESIPCLKWKCKESNCHPTVPKISHTAS